MTNLVSPLLFEQLRQCLSPGCLRRFLGGLTTVVALVSSPGLQPVVAQEENTEAVDFDLPEECLVDLTRPVPRPTEAEADSLLANLASPANPLTLPTKPEEVAIAEEHPLTLEQAIAVAEHNSPSLEISRLTLERSQAALREAQASLYPTVDLAGQISAFSSSSVGGSAAAGATGSGNSTAAGLPSVLSAVSANGTLSYDWLTGGRREAQIAIAAGQLRQQELSFEPRESDLRLQTTQAYYDVQGAQEQIRISRAFLAEACRNLRDTRLFYEAEVGTRFDVLRAEVQVATARQDYVDALTNWQTARRQLASLLSLPPAANVTTTTIAIAGAWPLSLEESIVLAYQNRAELEDNLVQREIAAAQQQVALSAIRPQVQATSTLALAAALTDISSAGLPGFDSNFSAGASVEANGRWRVFDGGAARAGADQATRDLAIAAETFSQDRNQIRLDVETAYYNLASNQANIEAARKSVESAKESLRLARRRYDAGVGDFLDVLVAQRELAQAEGNLVSAILGYNRSLAAMERATTNLADHLPESPL